MRIRVNNLRILERVCKTIQVALHRVERASVLRIDRLPSESKLTGVLDVDEAGVNVYIKRRGQPEPSQEHFWFV